MTSVKTNPAPPQLDRDPSERRRVRLGASLPYGDAVLFRILREGEPVQMGDFAGAVTRSTFGFVDGRHHGVVRIDGYVLATSEWSDDDDSFAEKQDQEADLVLFVRFLEGDDDDDWISPGQRVVRLGDPVLLGRLQGRVVSRIGTITVRVSLPDLDSALVDRANERLPGLRRG